jgi:bifunctional non-homologous end joining protein LigD
MSERLLPMLAARGTPFDSAEYLFEVKWNGIRALAARSHGSQPTGGWDLWGRAMADYRTRYPEMQVLAALPPGTILDGELVLLPEGLPDLEAILARHQLTNPAKIQQASRQQPVTYVVFDLLAHQGRSLLGQPLQARRAVLQDLLARWQEPRVQFSDGVVGQGRVFFEQAVRQGQEGVMAKHLASRYLPGKRSSCWLKIKPARRLPCVIIGWERGVCGVRGLLVAAPWGGRLRYVANVRTGFTDLDRRRLAVVLAALGRSRPVVSCPYRGLWVKPEVLCQINYLEWTRAGRLRGASFHDWHQDVSSSTTAACKLPSLLGQTHDQV